jgi:TolB-like protein/Tfp pilus assembly protein PilF
MDLLSRIAGWLGENEATISAVVGIAVLAGIVFAGVRSLVRRRGEAPAEKAPASNAESPAATDSSPLGLDPLTVPGFEGRPAIAVLPFDNLSGDPEQEYFADGIAEDLITRLSACRDFPVIARNSSFTYKGKPVDVKQVSRELGVRYIVEGSVRRASDRVRISAQLIDATTGAHIWAERYDRELRDIFALQDEITDAIAASMRPELQQSEEERAVSQEPQNLEAWDWAMQGWWHHSRFTREENAKARSLFERAIELDPHLVLAHVGVATTHHFDLLFQWSDSRERSVAELERAARRCVVLDAKNPHAQEAMGIAYRVLGESDKAIAAFDRAIRLNPSLGIAYFSLGLTLTFVGRPEEGIEKLDKAMRLSPYDPTTWLFCVAMALAHSAAGRDEEAVDWAQRSLQHRPDWLFSYLTLAASYAHLDRIEEARAALAEALRLQPGFSLSGLQIILSAARPAFLERAIDGLRKAGLPE